VKMRIALLVFECLALAGCAANINRTHRGQLVDDKVTAQRVQSALARAGDDFKNVQAGATNGVVVLTGNVRSPQIRSRAEQIASGVHRVGSVKDNLQVQK